ALGTLPPGLAVGPSRAQEKRMGIWCVETALQKGIFFGPLEGDLERHDITGRRTPQEQLCYLTILHTRLKICEGPSSFASLAQSKEERNVAEFTLRGKIYFRVCKVIEPGAELLVWPEDATVCPEEEEDEDEEEELTSPQKAESAPDGGAKDEARSAVEAAAAEEEEYDDDDDDASAVSEKGLEGGAREPLVVYLSSCLRDSSSPCPKSLKWGETTPGGDPEPPNKRAKADSERGGALGLVIGRTRLSARLAGKPRKVHAVVSRAQKQQQEQKPKRLQQIRDEGKATPETLGSRLWLQSCDVEQKRFSRRDSSQIDPSERKYSYSSEESFKAHVLFHQGERPFKCKQCDKAYGTKRDLREHEVLHTGERPFECDECGKTFARRPSLRIHKKIHRMKELNLENPKACKCVICEKELANPGSLRNHMRQMPELRRHLISHTGEAHLCTVCGKALKDPHTLRAHERLHTGERPFKCEQCGKAYTLATKLRRHQKSHLEEKPYKCNLCGMGYTLMQSLKRHRLSHGAKELAEAVASLEGGRTKKPASARATGKRSVRQAVKENNALEPTVVVLNDEVIQITISDHDENCIIVEEGDSQNNLVIIQEDIGFNTVAEVIEIERGP
uniref:Zinc finger protein 408 n=1 Tax=Latimeria chalumnae TaxID=7897 RepID=H3BHN7_LATCH